MLKIKYKNNTDNEIVLQRDPPFILKTIEGVDALFNTITSISNYNQDGETKISDRYEPRDITVHGHLIADSAEDKAHLRRELIQVFNRDFAGTLFYEIYDKSYSIDVEVVQAPTFAEEEQQYKYIPFQIMLKALDPYFVDTSFYDSLIPLSKTKNLFEFPLNITENFEFATITFGDIIEISNKGDVAVGAVFYFSFIAEVTNPTIYNVLTQESFGFEGTYGPNTRFELSTVRGNIYAYKIVDGVKTNAMNDRIKDSAFLKLSNGLNYLQVQTKNEVSGALVSIKFQPLVIGV